MDWKRALATASGDLLAPIEATNRQARYTVPCGVPCSVKNLLAGGAWRPYRTKLETGYERFETYKDLHYEFRLSGGLLKIHRRFVRHREDDYASRAAL